MSKQFKILSAFFLSLLLIYSGSLAAAQQESSYLADDLTIEEEGDIDTDLSLAASIARFKLPAGGNDQISRTPGENEPAANIEDITANPNRSLTTVSFSSYRLSLLNSSHSLPYYLLYHCSKDYLA